MSDNVPLEIQIKIIQRIPDIKSVIQFRAVSKAWKSIIDSKEFVTGHTLRHIQQQPRHLLIGGIDSGDPREEVKYVSIVDDDSFPHQKFNLSVPEFCKKTSLVGSSHGLFCFHDYNKNMAVIWNPSIRKTVLTTVVPYQPCSTFILFGVCHNTLDPKIVKIPHYSYYIRNASIQVEVFTLSSGAWRSPLSNTSPPKSILLGNSRAVVDGILYCNAVDYIITESRMYPSLIMSFDLTSEEFTELYLPNDVQGLYVYNLRESLGVFQFSCDTHTLNLNVWIMRGRGCTRSFEKLYHISPSDASISMPLGFRTSGAPIFEVKNDQRDLPVSLAAYEPESKDITEIWSYGIADAFRVHSYMETLLLLGQ